MPAKQESASVSQFSKEQLAITTGEWITYDDAYSQADKIMAKINGFNIPWIWPEESSDFYKLCPILSETVHIFFSDDPITGIKASVPRAFISTRSAHHYGEFGSNRIDDIGGIAPGLTFDPDIAQTVYNKLNEFDKGRKALQEVVLDGMDLDTIKNQMTNHIPLTKDQLRFLNEIDRKIYLLPRRGSDPRIAEIRAQRTFVDLYTVFACKPGEVALAPNQISTKTKVYVGPITREILERLPAQTEFIYNQFPERRVDRTTVIVNEKDMQTLLEDKNIDIKERVLGLLTNKNFLPHSVRIVKLRVGAFGFTENPTHKEILDAARLSGLKQCSPEIAISLVLSQIDNQNGDIDWFIPIDPDSIPKSFRLRDPVLQLWLENMYDELCLHANGIQLTDHRYLAREYIFTY